MINLSSRLTVISTEPKILTNPKIYAILAGLLRRSKVDTDSFTRYSVIKMLCGIFSILIILSFIAFPKNRTDQIIVEPLLKDARPYKTEIISNLYKKYYPRHYTFLLFCYRHYRRPKQTQGFH